MSVKIAMIGAGSIGFTRRLMQDFLCVPELRDVEFRFQDISERNLDMVACLCRRDIEANGLAARVRATLDREEALRDANFVINTARVGGLEAFKTDVEIPLRYGIDQCVGDTICAGGLMYGQRTVPMVVELCEQIERYAHPDAMLLNYANPMAMNTWAALEESNVPTVGLCHGVQGGHHLLTRLIQQHVNEGRDEEDPDFVSVQKDDVDISAVGINHQTWYMRVVHDGIEYANRLLPLFEANAEVSENEKVRMDMIKRFGYFSTESNGHLSEYVPWYRKRTDEIAEWTSLNRWIHGETAGYLRVCTENRNWFETEFPRWLEEPPWQLEGATRSDEHGSWIIEALVTGRTYRGHFNVRNGHTITNLPSDCIVEVPGYVDRNGMSIPQYGDLPAGCAAILNNSVQVQRMAKNAALMGDVELLKQSVLLDPLVGAVCNPPEVWHMVDAMLVAQAEWLPQYANAIPSAKQRLAKEPDRTRSTSNGALRLQTRSVDAMRAAQA
ncbi:MAG: alpha-galactosidase [Gammaproteobacteria bacterium]|nr:alpha-galactosidase [Gammaproteobacteria bacterium]